MTKFLLFVTLCIFVGGCSLGRKVACERCNGSGKVEVNLFLGTYPCPKDSSNCVSCNACKGSGELKLCRKCDGSKFIDSLNQQCNYCSATGIDPNQ